MWERKAGMKSFTNKYRQNDDGGFAIMFAVSASVLALGVAFALDYSRMSSTQASLTDMADAAALAGALVADSDKENRVNIARQMLTANGHKTKKPISIVEPSIVFDDSSREVRVKLAADIDLLFMGVLGSNKLQVKSNSTVSYHSVDVNPVSVSFALDVSGSMGDVTSDGRTKIEVLKSATKELFDAIEDGMPPNVDVSTKIRSGMTAYNTEVVEEYPMNYGWTSLEANVDKLVAQGGTNSTPALQNSYDQLVNDPVQPKGLRQFVIFMTDGDNNKPEWDEESAELCFQMRREGIEIFSVAFDAPNEGQFLLVDCATPSSEEFDEADEDDNDDDFDDDDFDDDDDDDDDDKNPKKCKKKKKGKGLARGHDNCKGPKYDHYTTKEDLDNRKKDKKEHYFDASNAKAFEDAFRAIGGEIAKGNVVIKN